MLKYALVGAAAALVTGFALQDEKQDAGMHKPPAVTKEHKFLKQLVGNWESDMECSMGPDKTVKMKGSETSRMLGDYWYEAEMKGDMPAEMGGGAFTGHMTIGYDSKKGKVVGTWVDNMTDYLWVYEGTLDEATKTITLETTGPNMADPSSKEYVRYRETQTLNADGTKTFSSAMEMNGTFVPMMKGVARKK